MNELALFAGAGGGILGGKLLGWRTVCAVEFDEHARNVLVARQNDGCLQPFPIWDDVRTFRGEPWRGIVDVVSGGFPCQDISTAGHGIGLDGERSGLWSEMARIIGEVRPRFALVENSPALVVRGIGRVLGDLAEMGYDARWGVFSAADAGAQHERERVWIVAHSNEIRWKRFDYNAKQHFDFLGEMSRFRNEQGGWNWVGTAAGTTADNAESVLLREHDGMANSMDRVQRIGNGQVPAVVRLAWETLTGGAGMNTPNAQNQGLAPQGEPDGK